MSAFDRAVELVLANEGGLNLEADDPGGRTAYGISERAHPGAWANGPPSREAAIEIYRRHYWDAIHGDELPAPVAIALMDFAVQSGAGRAVPALQWLAGARVDGQMGADTVARVKRWPAVALAEQLCQVRLSFLRLLGMTVPAHARRQRGYLNRIGGVIAAIQKGAA